MTGATSDLLNRSSHFDFGKNWAAYSDLIDEQRVALLNAGLGDHTGTAHIDVGEGSGQHRGGSSHVSDKGQLTSIVTIDNFGLSDVSLIQLDVEAYELNALRGAAATIERCRPVTEREYLGVGGVPGLPVWSTQTQFDQVRAMLERITSSNQ